MGTAPKRLRLTRPEPSESAVMSAIITRLRYHPAVVFIHRLNSGAHVVGAGKDKRFIRYGFPGCPDLVVGLKHGATAWIEVKRPSGRVRIEQDEFISLCHAHGIPAGIARSQDDAVAIVDDAMEVCGSFLKKNQCG